MLPEGSDLVAEDDDQADHLWEELRSAAQNLGASISLVPPPADPRQAWQQRANNYKSQYAGPAHWVRFIDVLAATGSVSMAARHAGVTVQKVSKRRERYPVFASHVLGALEYFNSAVLEHAAVIRAVDGIDEPVFHNGMIVGHKRRYSDALMAKLLEGNYPTKYRQRTELTGKDGTPLVPDVPSISDTERLALLAAVFEAARSRRDRQDQLPPPDLGAPGGATDPGVSIDG